MVRFCSRCAFATIWNLPSSDLQTSPPLASSSPPAYAFEPLASSTVNLVDPPPSADSSPSTTVVFESLAELMGSTPSNRRIYGAPKLVISLASALKRSVSFPASTCPEAASASKAKTLIRFRPSSVLQFPLPGMRRKLRSSSFRLESLIPGSFRIRSSSALERLWANPDSLPKSQTPRYTLPSR